MESVLFRCSGLSNLVASSRESITDNQIELLSKLELKGDNITDKQRQERDRLIHKRDNPVLSESLKSFVEDKWRKDKYGYEEIISTDAMLKGHLMESEGRRLIRSAIGGEPRLRYGKQHSNEYIIGTPDIVLSKEDVIEDIKNSETLKTFMNASPTHGNIWQAQGYMWLLNKPSYRLCYVLNPDPHEILQEKLKRIYFKYNCDEENEDYIKDSNQIEHNNKLINSLSDQDRVKV